MIKIDRKNLLIISISALALFVLGFLVPYIKNRNTQITPATPKKADQIVQYTNEGFSPKNITIKAGATVGWINISKKPMWIASNPHPSHTDLEEFDQQRIIQAGFYTYSFIKSGEWKYHNHIYPQDQGSIIVEP